ncbi:RNA-directed DNA polymerase, eukaryota [Tanacetum coccineum]
MRTDVVTGTIGGKVLVLGKECSVAVKMQGEIDSSFRRHVRGGVETQQLENIQDLVRSKVLSNVDDRWAWDLNGDGDFCVKDARDLVDEVLLPKENVATRWIKTIPIKVNVFAWKLHLDRLPTRSNLLKRGIQVQSSLCPICNVLQEDTSHLFFSCDVALAISRLICRWWNVSWSPVDSYSGWLEWFNSIRLGSKLKGILEGVFYVSWWCLWNFRNQLLFASKKPRKETLFDDVVSRSFIWSNSRFFEENDISLIATFIGKPVMLDSYTSSMCNDSWGRSSFARCLIETSNVVTSNAEKTNDGFQTMGKTKKRKGKSKSTNGGQFTGLSFKHNTTDNSSKKDNLSMSNSFSALNEEEEDEEDVENVYDESANLFQKQ